MITRPSDRRERAGAAAEEQMTFYLHREFNGQPDVQVLHGLRLEDREQPEQDGSPGVCQIDHLVVHRWGMFIVESKSVTEEVQIRPDGTGGDEWIRVYRGRERGMPSPIQQARRQSNILRGLLEGHGEKLLGRMPVGLRTAAKVINGSDQKTFRHTPIQLIVAVSDTGNIRRIDGWTEPRKRFRLFVCKADQVPNKIRREFRRHRQGSHMLRPTDDYGLWTMETHEVERVARFLEERHVDRGKGRHARSVPGMKANDAACKHCGAEDLHVAGFYYGYYWRCGVCDGTTNMPTVCSSCGAKGRRGKVVRIRKEGRKYFRDCESCEASEIAWIEK